MSRRSVGWGDESVVGGFSDHKENRFRGKRGEKYIMRAVTTAEEFRVHEIDNVAKTKSGTPITFSINCGKTWDETKEDWAGACLACEREYDVKARYICGILLLGIIKGRSEKPQLIDDDHAVLYWDFAATTYEKFRNHHFNLKNAEGGAKELKQVELLVTCGPKKDDEEFQKLDINIYQGKKLTTREHAAAFKERGRKLIEAASGATTPKEMKRQLSKRKTKGQQGDASDGEDYGEDKSDRKKHRKPEPKPEPDDQGEDQNEGEGEDYGTSGDEDMDAILDMI